MGKNIGKHSEEIGNTGETLGRSLPKAEKNRETCGKISNHGEHFGNTWETKGKVGE